MMATFGVAEMGVTTSAHLPMTANVAYELPNNTRAAQYFTLLPLSADKTRVFCAHTRNFARAPALDFLAKSAMKYVVGDGESFQQQLVEANAQGLCVA